ncbi:MAG: ArsR/SmtB family transcription factor [Rhodothalassiaceae bacterium]
MEQLLAALRAAGEPTRLRILALLGHGELTVTELTQILRQSQPRVSRHLRLMCDARLLDRFREGAWVFYRLSDLGGLAHLARTIVDMVPEHEPELQRDLERLADVRAQRAKEAQDYFARHAADWNHIRSLYVPEEKVEAALLAQSQGARSILDVGTGTGRILEIMAPLVERGLGIDLSPDMLSIARTKLADEAFRHCQVRLGDMYDLPVDNSTQDLVVFHQVLHFSDDPALALREAARVLTPGGQCLIVDFAPHDKEFLREQHAHRRLGFASAEIRQWAEAAALELVDEKPLEGGELTVILWRLAPAASDMEIAA